jgi:hypothetical protein
MRIANIISNLGIQNAQQSAKLIVRNDADAPVFARLDALIGYASRLLLEAMRGALRLWRDVTCGMKPLVMCGAWSAAAEQRSRRTHQTTMRRHAAS